jgi:aryl-alcohol dehydrogenase (NADP+)
MYQDRYWHEREFEATSQIVAVAKAAGVPAAQLAMAWVLAQPGVTCAIIGASRPDQLAVVLAAAHTPLEPAVLARLDELTRGFRVGDATR